MSAARRGTPADLVETSPFPCALKVGDLVTFTNDYGATFDKIVRGFTPEPLHGRFVYLDLDCWWMPVAPESLALRGAA